MCLPPQQPGGPQSARANSGAGKTTDILSITPYLSDSLSRNFISWQFLKLPARTRSIKISLIDQNVGCTTKISADRSDVASISELWSEYSDQNLMYNANRSADFSNLFLCRSARAKIFGSFSDFLNFLIASTRRGLKKVSEAPLWCPPRCQLHCHFKQFYRVNYYVQKHLMLHEFFH